MKAQFCDFLAIFKKKWEVATKMVMMVAEQIYRLSEASQWAAAKGWDSTLKVVQRLSITILILHRGEMASPLW